MPLPRHFLQSSKYNNVTTIRASQDRFCQGRWDSFLYASRLASALGIWPWSDVFFSTEADNLLLSTLSAGPVGVGDLLGPVDADNLLEAVRADGLIVKPDVPLVPLDATIISDAQGQNAPMIASTYTDFGAMRALYVYAYNRASDSSVSFRPASLGLTGQVYVYNYYTGSGTVTDALNTFADTITGTGNYYIVVPIGNSGIAFLGDAGQFVPLGKKRVPLVTDTGAVEATILFATGETSRTLEGYSPLYPNVTAVKGQAGQVDWDPSTGLFTVDVSPSADSTALVVITQSHSQPRPRPQ
jgi:hypothetical protein